MVINQKVSTKQQLFDVIIVRIVFAETVFVGSIISSHVMTELSIILAKYLLFLQLHVAGFQI